MPIHNKTILHIVCETEENTDSNLVENCYISEDFYKIYDAELAGWAISPDGKSFCPNCKKFQDTKESFKNLGWWETR